MERGKQMMRKLLSAGLIFALVLGMFSTGGQTAGTVKAAGKKSLRLSASSLKLKEGEKKKLKLISQKGIKLKKVKYTSTDKKKVTVTKKGVVTAKRQGKAKIRCIFRYREKKKAKYKKKTLTCKVTVSAVKKTSAKPKETPAITASNKPEPTSSAAPRHTPSAKPGEDENQPDKGEQDKGEQNKGEQDKEEQEKEQQGTISGCVKAKQGSTELRVLTGAEVTVYDTEDASVGATTTTETGEFITQKLTAGKTYRVVIRKEGFREKTFENVAVEADRTTVPGGGEIVLLSQSVDVVTLNTAVVRVRAGEEEGETADKVITAPDDVKEEVIEASLANPEGGTVSMQGEDAVCVAAEDPSVKKVYKLVRKERREAHRTHYDYQTYYEESFYCRFWLEIGRASDSEDEDKYDIYLCNELLSDVTQIPEEKAVPITFYREEDAAWADRYVKADKAYLRVYVRLRETEEDFPSKWKESIYSQRGNDNAFRFDLIP